MFDVVIPCDDALLFFYLLILSQLKKSKFKGVIWQRTPAEEGGQFFKCYGTLKDGRLDFYKNEQDYLDHQNPLNKKPYKMWQFNVETDHRCA